jgi:hypothetical protein
MASFPISCSGNTAPTSSNSVQGNMDEILKSRQMASATARRKKMQERQKQAALDREKFEERKKEILMHDYRADRISRHMDELEDMRTDDVAADIGRFDRESSTETRSECSVSTPDDSTLHRAQFEVPPILATSTTKPLKIHVPNEEEILQKMELDPDRLFVQPSPKPILQASLATWSDFHYDRFSAFLESPVLETLGPESDTEETFSPIETATPISYQQPKSRPSLISIVSTSQRSKKRTPSLQSPLSQTSSITPERPAKLSKQQSNSSIRSGYPAAEATEFQVPDLPDNAFQLIANASQDSLPLSIKERRKSKADRKSGMPLLSTALSHARMSSIKSLMKTPTSMTPTTDHRRSLSRHSSHFSTKSMVSLVQTETAQSAKETETPNPASTSTKSITTRPTSPNETASIRSRSSTLIMTALPRAPTSDDLSRSPVESVASRHIPRKKSFSALRRRSESIGQAIKGLSKSTGKHDVPMPTTPGPVTPNSKSHSRDLSNFPTPPLPPHSRPGTSSAGSFASGLMRSGSAQIGLGLRS